MAKKLQFDLHTGVAYLIWAALMTWAYHTHNPEFQNYATWLTVGLGSYTTKRLIQKKKEFNGVQK